MLTGRIDLDCQVSLPLPPFPQLFYQCLLCEIKRENMTVKPKLFQQEGRQSRNRHGMSISCFWQDQLISLNFCDGNKQMERVEGSNLSVIPCFFLVRVCYSMLCILLAFSAIARSQQCLFVHSSSAQDKAQETGALLSQSRAFVTL
ncbi:hypothetical protein BT93_F1457 [Corymbia citriodora subsp. variegata]|nr:hypothetical protein BT93_F1457 [Corymbia citriodora subsp. variegata]